MLTKKWTPYRFFIFLALVSLSACTFQMEVLTPEPSANADLQKPTPSSEPTFQTDVLTSEPSASADLQTSLPPFDSTPAFTADVSITPIPLDTLTAGPTPLPTFTLTPPLTSTPNKNLSHCEWDTQIIGTWNGKLDQDTFITLKFSNGGTVEIENLYVPRQDRHYSSGTYKCLENGNIAYSFSAFGGYNDIIEYESEIQLSGNELTIYFMDKKITLERSK